MSENTSAAIMLVAFLGVLRLRSLDDAMSNVQECIDLYLEDEVVTDAQFRAVIKDANERDQQERITYWNNMLEARAERERLDNLEGK